ncbi:MAG: VWA domain-containing protein [Acidobacteriota bacterium]
MHFARPDYGQWLLGGLVLLLALRWRFLRRHAASTSVEWIGREGRASVLRRIPSAVLLVALALAALGVMQPVLPFAEAEVKSRGLDLVMVLDLSSSMQEPIGVQATQRASGPIVEGKGPRPPQPAIKSRLDATKDAIKSFVGRRRGDRVGLVVFSDNAYVVCPLSSDHEYLATYIDMVDAEILKGEGMTALGDGLALANYLLERQTVGADTRGRVVVLLTDGENNRGRDPVEVLAQSNAARIRVHVVGVDLEARIRQKPEVERLVAAVRSYGGRYFDANTVADLDAASRIIDGIEKGVVTTKVYSRDVPVFQWFVIPALICLALAMALCAVPQFTDLT